MTDSINTIGTKIARRRNIITGPGSDRCDLYRSLYKSRQRVNSLGRQYDDNTKPN